MAKKKTDTGLGAGIDAFFTDPVTAPPKEKKDAHERPAPANENSPARRTAWLREDHLERLELLKFKERQRLKQEGKRVSLTSLIDEALEQYLAQKEQ